MFLAIRKGAFLFIAFLHGTKSTNEVRFLFMWSGCFVGKFFFNAKIVALEI